VSAASRYQVKSVSSPRPLRAKKAASRVSIATAAWTACSRPLGPSTGVGPTRGSTARWATSYPTRSWADGSNQPRSPRATDCRLHFTAKWFDRVPEFVVIEPATEAHPLTGTAAQRSRKRWAVSLEKLPKWKWKPPSRE